MEKEKAINLLSLTENDKREINALKLFYSNIAYLFKDDNNPSVNTKNGYFYAIPVNNFVIDILKFIRKNFNNHYSFLDVGCGKGNILHIANALGFNNIHGIEYNKIYRKYLYDVSYRLCDAFKFENYHNYDVIYAYMPICDNKKMTKLIKLVKNKMKKDSIFIFLGINGYKPPFLNKNKISKNCIIDFWLWQKKIM